MRKLLELEIPEIKGGLVEIKAIARSPGVRCKIAVHSSDPKVDPIGSCVGRKGVRVQNITDELNGERIDVIQWESQNEKFIQAALSPAKISHIIVNEEIKRASIYVETDQRPLAIGKQGQNVRLASSLTGYELDILDIKDLPEGVVAGSAPVKPTEVPKEKEYVEKVENLEGLPKELVERLATANLTSVEQLKGLSVQDIASIEGVDEAGAQMVVDAVKKVK